MSFLAKKGTADDYSAMSPEGSWFGVRFTYEKGSSYQTITAGEFILSGGSISGAAYYINNVLGSESTSDLSQQGFTYSYDSST